MKKFVVGAMTITSTFIACYLFLFPITAAKAATNLVTNPSVETVGTPTTVPLSWATNKWGTNTAKFEYRTTGYEGTRSVFATVSGFKSGDAKWFFEPVVVSPNTEYTISDYYQSSVATKVVAVVYDVNNKVTYFDLNTNVPAKSVWTQFSKTFKTPASARRMSVYHVIAKNGWLGLDNMSVSTVTSGTTTPPVGTTTPPVGTTTPPVGTTTPPVGTTTPPVLDFPVNHSVETAQNATTPKNWGTGKWGTNSPTFQYVSGDGHDGTRSVKVTIARYTDGDAKWMFNSVPLTAGDYKFTAWYKTNVTPHVVVQYTLSDGTEAFSGLPNPEPASNSATVWQKYSDSFSVPSGVQSVTVFFFLTGNGWVQTDDYSITPYTYPPFTRGIVTLTFDDGFEGNVNTVLPKLAQKGFKSTHCFATQYVEGDSVQVQNVQTIGNAGHEICSHTVTHPFLTGMTDAQIEYELSHPKTFLESISGQQVTSFASPYGDYDVRVNNKIMQYYESHRTTDEGFNAKDNLAPYRLRVQNMTPNTTLAEFTGWVNKAKTDKTWLILLYHAITTTNPGEFDTLKSEFDKQMDALASSGVKVSTWKDAYAEVKGQ